MGKTVNVPEGNRLEQRYRKIMAILLVVAVAMVVGTIIVMVVLVPPLRHMYMDAWRELFGV
jgi:hypothetical protein